ARVAGAALAGWRSLARGLRLLAAPGLAGIPLRRGVRGLRAVGRGRVEAVAWDGGELACDLLLLHEGVIPDTQIGRALQLAHAWDAAQWCWRPVLDEWGGTSLANVSVAGDGGGIAGAAAAVLSGRLAALAAAHRLGRIDAAERDRRAAPIRARPRTRLPPVSRGADPAAAVGPRPAAGRRHRLPLRGGDRRHDPPRRPARRAGPEPGQGLHPLRHGPVPGPAVRPRRRRADGRDARPPDRRDRCLPPARPLQAGHRRHARGAGGLAAL